MWSLHNFIYGEPKKAQDLEPFYDRVLEKIKLLQLDINDLYAKIALMDRRIKAAKSSEGSPVEENSEKNIYSGFKAL
jgi:hypothetical protein